MRCEPKVFKPGSFITDTAKSWPWTLSRAGSVRLKFLRSIFIKINFNIILSSASQSSSRSVPKADFSVFLFSFVLDLCTVCPRPVLFSHLNRSKKTQRYMHFVTKVPPVSSHSLHRSILLNTLFPNDINSYF